MAKFSCTVPDCTIAITGKCLLSHSPVESCPNITAVTEADDELSEAQTVQNYPVYPGNELGLQQAASLMAARYGWLVGVLGAYGTGKTCLLSSLYLLASCGDLRASFLFAGSRTLPGFESRLRLLRQWNDRSRLPEQIVDHTILSDPRQPALLHLALLQTNPAEGLRELLFTDLPGEWTTDLIKRADAAGRLTFLRRADALVVTFPAPELSSAESRNAQLLYGRMLFQRLHESIGLSADLPIILAITRCDKSGVTLPPAAYKLAESAQRVGFQEVSQIPIASFSDNPEVPSGYGIANLLETIVQRRTNAGKPRASHRVPERMFGRYQFSLETET